LLTIDPLNPLSRSIAALHHLMSGDFTSSLRILETDQQSLAFEHIHRALLALLLVVGRLSRTAG